MRCCTSLGPGTGSGSGEICGERVVGQRRGSVRQHEPPAAVAVEVDEAASPRAPARCVQRSSSSARRRFEVRLDQHDRRRGAVAVVLEAAADAQPHASRSGRCCCCWLRLLARRPVLGASLDARRRQLVDRGRLRRPAHRLRHHRAALELAHRAEVLDRHQSRDGLVAAASQLRGSHRRRRAPRSSPAPRARPRRRPGRCRAAPRRRRSRGPTPTFTWRPVQSVPRVASMPSQP